jgi:hypothetical protein
MARDFAPKVVTANALIEGDVVYLTADDRWTRHLSEAELLIDEAEAEYRLLQAEARDMRPGERGPEPVHFREDFRRTGPSNLFHGKQSEGLSRA